MPPFRLPLPLHFNAGCTFASGVVRPATHMHNINKMVYVGIEPWLGLGVRLPANATYRQIAELAGFYTAEEKQLFIDGSNLVVPDKKAVDGAFRYLGVGRWLDDEAKWAIPEVDFTTWRTWGEGRETSRPLPDGALGRAQVVIDELLARPAEKHWLERADGRRARVLGAAARGGLRIDGGDGGFTERTVSVNDVAWVVAADDWARDNKTVLDEAVVNRCRYLAGTPKSSTRFIDTGWALALWQNGKSLVDRAAGGASASRKVRGANKKPLDATYSIEPVGDRLSIIFEARGGTAGSGGERNTEYVEGLRTLLERLGKHGVSLEDAFVESRDTLTLSPDERRIALTYPLSLEDADAARRALSSGQAKIGRAPGAKGSGNSTRRIRLLVRGIGVTALARLLA